MIVHEYRFDINPVRIIFKIIARHDDTQTESTFFIPSLDDNQEASKKGLVGMNDNNLERIVETNIEKMLLLNWRYLTCIQFGSFP